MKTVQSSLLRAVITLVVGALLVKYREETATWLTRVTGALFFLSGLIACAFYWSDRVRYNKQLTQQPAGTPPTVRKPVYPIAGVGSVVLGAALTLMAETFLNGISYVLAAILILGAVNAFVNLATATRHARVGLFYWLPPALVLLVGIIAIVWPKAIASAPLFILGWAIMLFGLSELLNALKSYQADKERKAQEKQAEEARQALEQQQAATQAEQTATTEQETEVQA